jgi:hypothetical protein
VRFFGGGFHKVYDADRKRKAMLRAAAAVIAAERARRATGATPRGWEPIVPAYLQAVPQDPYSGQPLRWKQTPTGFKIYSVWMNRADDGGLIHRTSDSYPKDCGVEFWDVHHRGKLPPMPLPEQEGE